MEEKQVGHVETEKQFKTALFKELDAQLMGYRDKILGNEDEATCFQIEKLSALTDTLKIYGWEEEFLEQ